MPDMLGYQNLVVLVRVQEMGGRVFEPDADITARRVYFESAWRMHVCM